MSGGDHDVEGVQDIVVEVERAVAVHLNLATGEDAKASGLTHCLDFSTLSGEARGVEAVRHPQSPTVVGDAEEGIAPVGGAADHLKNSPGAIAPHRVGVKLSSHVPRFERCR